MNDKELLEKAAKAAGIEVVRSRLDDPACIDFLIRKSPRNIMQELGPWNPLSDDGDALRLAVKLRMLVEVSDWGATAITEQGANEGATPEYAYIDGQSVGVPRGDIGAATRRAITRAAAAMVKE